MLRCGGRSGPAPTASATRAGAGRGPDERSAQRRQRLVAAGPAEPLRESEPSLYYLKDNAGNLLPSPGFKYDDFKDLYKLKNQLDQLQQRPRYSLQQIAAVGTVSGQRAELTIHFKILLDDKNWVRVPLRLEQAVLSQPVQYDGPGEQFTHFEENGEGYVAWIHGKPGEQHELTLKVLVSLTSAGRRHPAAFVSAAGDDFRSEARAAQRPTSWPRFPKGPPCWTPRPTASSRTNCT